MWTALVPVNAAGMFFHFVVFLIYGYLSSRRTLVGPHESSRSGGGGMFGGCDSEMPMQI